MNNFGGMKNNIPLKREQPRTLKEVYELALKFIEENRIDPNNFEGIYTKKTIKNDLDYVRRMEEKFKNNLDGLSKIEAEKFQELQMLATILESIIFNQIELNDWFGPDAHTILTSKFDDIGGIDENGEKFGGVDVVVEFISQEFKDAVSHLGLMIDVTLSKLSASEKLAEIKEDVLEGNLTKIKYFESENSNFKGELTQLPKFVVWLGLEDVNELANKKNKELNYHPVQLEILKGMLNQCNEFIRMAKEELINLEKKLKRSTRSSEREILQEKIKKINLVINAYEKAKNILEPIYKAKMADPKFKK